MTHVCKSKQLRWACIVYLANAICTKQRTHVYTFIYRGLDLGKYLISHLLCTFMETFISCYVVWINDQNYIWYEGTGYIIILSYHINHKSDIGIPL